MKRMVVIIAVAWGMAVPVALAGYTIDGSLSDWGVTPFTSWAPAGTANYTQTNNVNLYNANFYNETYDVEAMYFDDDAQKYYFAVVGSAGDTRMGDLGLDFNGDMKISEHGVVTGLEFAIQLETGTVLLNPSWSNTSKYLWDDGWQGSPYEATGGTAKGTADVVMQKYVALESGTFIIEVGVDKSLFPNMAIGSLVGEHYTMWCGNDSINLFGTVDGRLPPPPPAVPAPAGLLLACLGSAIVGGLRRRRAM